MSQSIQYKLIYNFQEKDNRDYTYTSIFDSNTNLETSTLNKNNIIITTTSSVSPSTFTISTLPPIINQGNLGDCVACAFSYCISKQTNQNVTISRLFLYAICRSLDDTPLNQDNGTTIRTACASLLNYGSCQESLYPYIISNYVNLPPLNTFYNSKRFKKFTYTFINPDVTSLKNCLKTYNVPIIFGFIVYSSFMSNSVSNSGNVPIPNKKTERIEGGHCMNIVGYNDSNQTFICANSWGTNWGNKGYCNIPYNYLLDPTLASDFCFTQFIY
jgi:C1A family cysteine protease